jgi:hypothetical protein
MAKLIHSSIECGHKHNSICLYPMDVLDENKLCLCNPTHEENFPKKCPLENGQPTPKYKNK